MKAGQETENLFNEFGSKIAKILIEQMIALFNKKDNYVFMHSGFTFLSTWLTTKSNRDEIKSHMKELITLMVNSSNNLDLMTGYNMKNKE